MIVVDLAMKRQFCLVFWIYMMLLIYLCIDRYRWQCAIKWLPRNNTASRPLMIIAVPLYSFANILQ